MNKAKIKLDEFISDSIYLGDLKNIAKYRKELDENFEKLFSICEEDAKKLNLFLKTAMKARFQTVIKELLIETELEMKKEEEEK